jgi:hypothetical protein
MQIRERLAGDRCRTCCRGAAAATHAAAVALERPRCHGRLPLMAADATAPTNLEVAPWTDIADGPIRSGDELHELFNEIWHKCSHTLLERHIAPCSPSSPPTARCTPPTSQAACRRSFKDMAACSALPATPQIRRWAQGLRSPLGVGQARDELCGQVQPHIGQRLTRCRERPLTRQRH